jgi:hypothetical protein
MGKEENDWLRGKGEGGREEPSTLSGVFGREGFGDKD